MEAPGPPYGFGMVSPMKPALTRSLTLSQGYSSSASQRAARARKTESASSRARVRSASCSAVNLKSMQPCLGAPQPAPSPEVSRRRTALGNSLDMDRMAEGGECGLEGRLGERGVGVDGVDDLLQRGLERPPHRELVDQLGGLGTDDVHPEQLAGGLVRHHLDEPVGLAQRDRLPTGGEWEL